MFYIKFADDCIRTEDVWIESNRSANWATTTALHRYWSSHVRHKNSKELLNKLLKCFKYCLDVLLQRPWADIIIFIVVCWNKAISCPLTILTDQRGRFKIT